MASFTSISQSKKLSVLFLNTSFLFLLSFYVKTYFYSSNNSYNHYDYSKRLTTITTTNRLISRNTPQTMNIDGCAGLHEQVDYQSKCIYLQSHVGCQPKGYIDYLQIFYCTCGQYPILGYALIVLWLVLLFYLLGDTAANYFCSSLECLSAILHLSPTIAGITLLSLGNGASDVFSSIVSFTRSGDGDFGLNSILGGAFFVSSVVVGIISILIAPHRQITIDKISFVRDVIFFIFALSSLLLIIFVGRVSLWGALCFISIYVLYVCAVCATQYFFYRNNEVTSCFSEGSHGDEFGEMGVPLLGYVDDNDEKHSLVEKGGMEDHHKESPNSIIGFFNLDSSTCYYLGKFLYVLELPLWLPRRLSIPVVSQERWSKPFAVISVALAPVLVVGICAPQIDQKFGSEISLVAYMTAGFVGLVLGNLAFVTTKKSSPPEKCLLPWLAGGFLMSVAWTYIIAGELVSLLVSIGNILGISPSVLGLTVLSWGNSLGDLITNATMAKDGGPDGAQIAITGCYAGPMFNTLVGLGLSLVLSSWSQYPSSYVIPIDTSLYETVGFLIGSLLWALVMLPKNNMQLDRLLGVGLLAIYFCFLFLSLARDLGLLKLY